jgi:PHP family Zn ribbon phosphoesterase
MMCQRCHAHLSEEVSQTATACPACGGALIPAKHLPLDTRASGVSAETVDHRGIVLPTRHAVGGIITPW